jgi:hypothetical protein
LGEASERLGGIAKTTLLEHVQALEKELGHRVGGRPTSGREGEGRAPARGQKRAS